MVRTSRNTATLPFVMTMLANDMDTVIVDNTIVG